MKCNTHACSDIPTYTYACRHMYTHVHTRNVQSVSLSCVASNQNSHPHKWSALMPLILGVAWRAWTSLISRLVSCEERRLASVNYLGLMCILVSSVAWRLYLRRDHWKWARRIFKMESCKKNKKTTSYIWQRHDCLLWLSVPFAAVESNTLQLLFLLELSSFLLYLHLFASITK